MTEPGSSEPTTAPAPQTMQERYGVRSANQRRLMLVASAAVALALLTWLAWAAWEHGRPHVSGRVYSYDVVSAHEVRLVVDIHRLADGGVTCDISAEAVDHVTVGEDQVLVPPGPAGDVRTTVLLRTDRRAVSADLSNCRLSG